MSFDNKEYQKRYYEQVKASKLKKPPKVSLPRTELQFSTIDGFKKYTSELIEQYMDTVITEDHSIYKFCVDLYERHPDFDGNIPSQFIFFSHKRKYKSPSLKTDLYRSETYRPHYRGTDGFWHTYSIMKCINAKDQTYKQRLLACMRNEINSDILEYRRSNPFCIKCKCSDISILEVDHTGEKEFSNLAQEFINTLGDKQLDFYKEGVRYLFKNRNIANDWIRLHREESNLQTLCKQCHYAKTY